MRYADVRDFTVAGLKTKGYGTANPDVSEIVRTMPLVNPGPPTLKALQSLTPSSMLFLTLGNGAGLTAEATYDRRFITVRVVGLQNNFDYAEGLAYDVDNLYLGVTSGPMGNGRALYISRSGGAPQLVDFDSASRYHFQTTYIAEVLR